MIKKALAVLAILFVSNVHNISAQSPPNGNLENLSGCLSPSAGGNNGQSLGVDKYTGKLQVGLPIYSYQNKSTGLHHSITLGYQGGGITADELASNVGLGWSLNTGGVITRQVNGLPDELPTGFTGSPSNILTGSSSSVSAGLASFAEIKTDGEYDDFSFSAGDISGKFIIGKGGGILQIPLSNVRISQFVSPPTPTVSPFDSCYNIGFKITMPDGTKYIYSNFDCSPINFNDDFSYHQNIYASSTWYLSKIIAPFNKDSICFDYSPVVIQYFAGTEYTEYIYTPSSGSYIDNMTTYTVNNWTRDMRLTDIKYPDGTIVNFNYDAFNRLDMQIGNALNNITITNGTTSYGYKFNYSYSWTNGSTVIMAYQDYSASPPADTHDKDYRLLLNNYKMFSGTDTLPQYSFIYNSPLPVQRGSSSNVDFWGYYSSTATGRVPSTSGSTIEYNRSSNISGEAGSLQEIILPDGGNDQFVYELNSTPTGSVGGIRIKQLIASDSTGQNNHIVHEYHYVQSDGVTSSGIIGTMPINDYVYSELYGSASTTYVTIPYHYIGALFLTETIIVSGTTYNYDVYTDAAENSLMYTHGSPVGYSMVEEYLGTSADYKRETVYQFTDTFYALPSCNSFPFPEQPTIDFACGLPISISEYNAAGLLLSNVTNSYNVYLEPQSSSDTNYLGIKVGVNQYDGTTSTSDYTYKSYSPVTGKIFKSSSTSTTYFEGGNSMVNTVGFTNDTFNMVLRGTNATDSRGDVVVTNYYYPYDFSISGAINALKDSGNIYFPIRTEVWDNGLAGSNVTSYQQLSDGSIKPQASYQLAVSAPVSSTSWGTFSPSQLLQNPSSFNLLGTMDKYDSYGNLLQTTIKGKSNTTIWGYDKQSPIANVANAANSDVAYTSFEGNDNDYGNWVSSGGITLVAGGFTGNYAANMVGGFLGLGNSLTASGLNPSITYIISLWSFTGPDFSVTTSSGSTVTLAASDSHMGWTLYKATFSGSTSITVSGGADFDELRLYPLGAAMTTSTYNPLFGVTSKCDASNRTVYYEYDDFGRPKDQRDMDNNIVRKYDYAIQAPQY